VKSILITGSNGLIGHELVNNLKNEHEVYAISRSMKGNVDGIEYINVNFSENWSEEILPKQIDVIYHLAQSEHFREFPSKSLEIFNVNTSSTLKLLEYGRKAQCKQFIYASSGGVYGNAEKGFVEDEPLVNKGNLGFYLSTKFCSELLVENYNSFFDIVITRFFFVYGERQDKSMLIPRLIENIKNGNEISLQGNEGIKINPIYVTDASNALSQMIALSKGNYKFNIGGNEILSLREICETIGELIGKAPKFKILKEEPKNLIGDISKMKEMLTTPVTSINSGLSSLLSK
jgi:UDP-glucose 4-epimerase